MSDPNSDSSQTGDQGKSKPAGLFAHTDFVFFMISRLANVMGVQMMTVAVGWHVYQMTANPLDLGLVGLFQFAPAFALFLVAGVAADRFDRRRIITACNAAHMVAALLLLAYIGTGGESVWPIFTILVLHGAARAFLHPAGQAIVPNIVPAALFPNAVAASAATNKIGQLGGPALGGLLIALVGEWIFVVAAGLFVVATMMTLLMRTKLVIHGREPFGWATILGGFSFIRRRPIVLGTISIDLVAVLFGGVMGLLPVYASDILHVGPQALGLMYAAPGAGALVVAIILARMDSPGRMGPIFFFCLTIFGTAIVVFSLSTTLWVSLLALVIYGSADMVSVYIRQTLVQIETPDDMRGRVSAVNSVSINASNELGDFRAGVMADLFGTVPAVLAGGIFTLAATALWWKVFPDLRRVDRLYVKS